MVIIPANENTGFYAPGVAAPYCYQIVFEKEVNS